MTMLLIPTTWRLNNAFIDMVEIMTSPHPMCKPKMLIMKEATRKKKVNLSTRV